MKTMFNVLLVAMAVGVAGCVNTVTQNQPGRMPDYKDRLEARYQRSVPEVFEASKRALNSFGNITSEGQIFVGTNEVRIVEGAINGRNIYMRIEGVEPKVTSAIVQVRTKMGGTDLKTAKEVIQRIAVELD